MMKMRLIITAALSIVPTALCIAQDAGQYESQNTQAQLSPASSGQSLTARERLLEFVARSSSAPLPLSATPTAAPPVVIAEPVKAEPIITEPVTSAPVEAPRVAAAPVIASPIAPATIAPAPIKPALNNAAQSYGFFTPAARYIAQRGDRTAPQLTLRYDVSSKNAKTAVLGQSKTVDIIIGTDYAAISKTPDEIIIYDFKTNRVLNYNPAEQTFTNASLYAAAYRNIDTVTKVTEGGTKRAISMAPGKTLDAFFLESSLGYAAGDLNAHLNGGLSLTQNGELIEAKFDGEPVFSAALNGPKLKDFRQAYSFISLLYHSEPVHPAVLAELKDVRAAPNAMTVRSYGPNYPDGKIFTWTLKSQMSETSSFPLPAGAKSVTEVKSVSPLGFVISEALAGRALGGQSDPRAMLTAINQRLSSGDSLSSWVSAQTLKDRLGGCEQLRGLCSAISAAEAGADSSPDLAVLIQAFKDIEKKSTRAEGLTALIPLISAADAPSVVLRRAGLALAKLPKQQAAASGLGGLDAADLLSQAIARNPYDLQAYSGLSKVHAARHDYIQSWDMNDALRAFEGAPSALTTPINRAESKLSARAPGFFPPVSQ